jgi:hypothetical protein
VINSHLLYQLSYRGMRAILLIVKGKSSERVKKVVVRQYRQVNDAVRLRGAP